MIDAMIDPWPPFTFCRPQAIVTASPPAPLAIRKAPSASVESIQPRPPQPCDVGRPKGRRRKNRRQSHKFCLATAARKPPYLLTIDEVPVHVLTYRFAARAPCDSKDSQRQRGIHRAEAASPQRRRKT